jgi:uncharacterized membrane-anchored protein
MTRSTSSKLPIEEALRATLHNEIHTRPSALIELPALVFYVAVINEQVSTHDELAHLKLLPGQSNLAIENLKANFYQIQTDDFSLIWERHTEFTRYTLIQKLPASVVNSRIFHWPWLPAQTGSKAFLAKPSPPYSL